MSVGRRLKRLEAARNARERGTPPRSTPESQAERERGFAHLYAELRELGAPGIAAREEGGPFGRLFELIERHRKETAATMFEQEEQRLYRGDGEPR